MGALAKSVKSAEAAVAQQETKFELPDPKITGAKGDALRQLSGLISQARTDPYNDLRRMSRYMPTSGDEAFRTGLKWTGILGGTGASLAALASYAGHLQAVARRKKLLRSVFRAGAVPGREVQVPFKTAADEEGIEKDAIDPLTVATVGGLAGAPMAYNWAAKKLGKIPKIFHEAFTTTSNPLTHPAAVPLMLGGTALATYGGYKIFDALFSSLRERRRKREMANAEREFDQALRAQYESPKAAALGNAVDGMAEAHVSGELQEQLNSMEKEAIGDTADPYQKAPWYRGVGSGGVGLYATLALLLALGGGVGAYSMAKKRDVSRRRRGALEKALRRRAMASPPQFIVEQPDSIGEEPV